MMANDDSAREAAANELLSSTAVLQALPDGIVLCDRAKIVQFINPAAAHVLQIDADACIGRSIDRLPGGIVLPSEIGDREYHQPIEIEHQDWRCNIRSIWSETRKKTQIGFLITIKPASLEIL